MRCKQDEKRALSSHYIMVPPYLISTCWPRATRLQPQSTSLATRQRMQLDTRIWN